MFKSPQKKQQQQDSEEIQPVKPGRKGRRSSAMNAQLQQQIEQKKNLNSSNKKQRKSKNIDYKKLVDPITSNQNNTQKNNSSLNNSRIENEDDSQNSRENLIDSNDWEELMKNKKQFLDNYLQFDGFCSGLENYEKKQINKQNQQNQQKREYTDPVEKVIQEYEKKQQLKLENPDYESSGNDDDFENDQMDEEKTQNDDNDKSNTNFQQPQKRKYIMKNRLPSQKSLKQQQNGLQEIKQRQQNVQQSIQNKKQYNVSNNQQIGTYPNGQIIFFRKSKCNQYQKNIEELQTGLIFEGSGNGTQFIVSQDPISQNQKIKIDFFLQNINHQIDVGLVRAGKQDNNNWDLNDAVWQPLAGNILKSSKKQQNIKCYQDSTILELQTETDVKNNDIISMIIDPIHGQFMIKPSQGRFQYIMDSNFKNQFIEGYWHVIFSFYKSTTRINITNIQIIN